VWLAYCPCFAQDRVYATEREDIPAKVRVKCYLPATPARVMPAYEDRLMRYVFFVFSCVFLLNVLAKASMATDAEGPFLKRQRTAESVVIEESCLTSLPPELQRDILSRLDEHSLARLARTATLIRGLTEDHFKERVWAGKDDEKPLPLFRRAYQWQHSYFYRRGVEEVITCLVSRTSHEASLERFARYCYLHKLPLFSFIDRLQNKSRWFSWAWHLLFRYFRGAAFEAEFPHDPPFTPFDLEFSLLLHFHGCRVGHKYYRRDMRLLFTYGNQLRAQGYRSVFSRLTQQLSVNELTTLIGFYEEEGDRQEAERLKQHAKQRTEQTATQ
jgi:hypothetical protein